MVKKRHYESNHGSELSRRFEKIQHVLSKGSVRLGKAEANAEIATTALSEKSAECNAVEKEIQRAASRADSFSASLEEKRKLDDVSTLLAQFSNAAIDESTAAWVAKLSVGGNSVGNLASIVSLPLTSSQIDAIQGLGAPTSPRNKEACMEVRHSRGNIAAQNFYHKG